MLLPEKRRRAIISNAWQAYIAIERAIDALSGIGLELEPGGPEPESGCRALYRALTAAANAISACFNIEPGTVYAEQADMVFAQYAKGVSLSNPESVNSSQRHVETALSGISDTAFKSGFDTSGSMSLYDVTVSMCGGITVPAVSEQAAIETVDRLDCDDVICATAWDDPSPTDAHDI